MSAVNDLKSAIAPERSALLGSLRFAPEWGIEGVRTFMETHVWAVWDFMSLVKGLQREMTCVSVPWVPVGDPEVRRFINEIVWGEESDLNRHGKATSHFEMYLEAMENIGANTEPIRLFVKGIAAGESVRKILPYYAPSQATVDFVNYTFRILEEKKIHTTAAVFTFGREDLIPDMFNVFIDDLGQSEALDTADLRYYLERHIEVDGDEHGPIALRLVEAAIGDDPVKVHEASVAAVEALRLRRMLWEDITSRIRTRETVM
jgi:hypothetical protein